MNINEDAIRDLVIEELTKTEVRSMIDSKLDDFLNKRELKKMVRGVVTDVIDDFFREMWRKNGFWKTSLKNG